MHVVSAAACSECTRAPKHRADHCDRRELGEVFVLLGDAHRYETTEPRASLVLATPPLWRCRCCRYWEARTEESMLANAPDVRYTTRVVSKLIGWMLVWCAARGVVSCSWVLGR